jgi:hypothetical protein
MSAKMNEIDLYCTFILKSNYHEGRFMIFEENRYWYGHLNALHVSHELSKKLLGSKLNDHIVADLGLGIYDAYQVTQIAKAPVYYRRPEILIGSKQNTTHRDRTLDGAREKMIIRGEVPETTLAILYSEIRENISNIRLRDMRKPRFKVPIQYNAHSKTTTNLHSSKTRKIDEEQSRAINVLEITELKLGIAIREKDSFLIAMALLDTEKIINQVEKKYRETARFESLMRRREEAKNFLDRYIP